MKEKTVAVLTIKRASEMTVEGRQEIAAWLRRQAFALQSEGDNYSTRFMARYLVAQKD